MKNKEAYAYAIMKYGLTDNMERMVIELIERIRNNFNSIKSNQKKLTLLKYLYANLSLSLPDYLQEREEVLKFLSDFNGDDYSRIIDEIREKNSNTFFYFNKDDKYIRTDSVEVISLGESKDDYSYAIDYKGLNDRECFYFIPISSRTTKISSDSRFKKIITDRLDEYKALIELNGYVIEMKRLKEQMNGRKPEKNKHLLEQDYRKLLNEYNNKKSIINSCIDNNEGLMELVKKEATKKYGVQENVSYQQVLPILIDLYKSTVLPSMVKTAANYLTEKNNDAKEFCEGVLVSLNSEIVSLECAINYESELYNYQFILDVLDIIYPGIKLELSDALRDSDKDKMNSIIDTIVQVLYLDDTEKVLVK